MYTFDEFLCLLLATKLFANTLLSLTVKRFTIEVQELLLTLL